MFTQATASDRKAEKKRRILNEETNALVANQPILRSTEQELNPGFRHHAARPKLQFGAFVNGLLQHQHPSAGVCYGSGSE